MPTRWTARHIPSQLGRRAIVTGANVGLGFETARELARAGAQVVLACRSMERGDAAVNRIRAEQPEAQLSVELLDLSSLASVRAFAEKTLAGGQPIDILVNNAGIMSLPHRQTGPDGFELQLATNYLGHYALTGLLLPALLASGIPRIVSLSSGAHKRGRLHFDDLQMQRNYGPFKSYAQTKLAMLVYALELQRQADAHGARLLSVGAHPGLSTTSIARELGGAAKLVTSLAFHFLGHSQAHGALPQLYAATAENVTPGGYYGPDGFLEFKGDPAPASVSSQASDPGAGARLWTVSEQLTGVHYAWPAE